MPRIVLIAGFESFNADLYRKAALQAEAGWPQEEGTGLAIQVFSDRDLITHPHIIETALAQADVFFASLLFDYDQVIWLRERVQSIPIRLIFESALELMSLTRLGKFIIGEKPKGMPKPIQFILSKFGSGNEEDKLAGYLSFLKVGPKLLKYIPAKKVQDLRNWLIIYGYWNAGGADNVAAMFWYIAQQYFEYDQPDSTGINPRFPRQKQNNRFAIPDPVETPNLGLFHPDHEGYFETPRAYLDWWRSRNLSRNRLTLDCPVVGILLYRKHVITKQPYIPKLIRQFEAAGLIPLPIFINGVEGHVAVRDWMTTAYEQAQRSLGNIETKSLSQDAAQVDAIISTIGFPLVGGPAGSMEAGRQVAVATKILQSKNVPYLIAAPLLIQDIHSWTRTGIGGLQSVVLYSLPELDGAIDTIPLGGLVGDDIYLIPERVQRLIGRVKSWIALRRKQATDRKIAIVLYGFPPGYGATGTAALLNVPKSLIRFLQALQDQGYEIGKIPEDGEELIRQIQAANDENAWALAIAQKAIPSNIPANTPTNTAIPNSVNVKQLERWLGYLQTSRIEKQWQSLTETGIKTYGDQFHVGGIQLGNIWIGVQPPLGISGDPMRLMFERDLTPHPQYAAYYQWLQHEFAADAIVHFGMHGTVEWLPGSPLGNTGYSWPDLLLGNLPNLYIYAANNPSESILAKRRGYGVLISHNVPPYGRAGLYKELVSLRELIAEYRENPAANSLLIEAIAKKIADTGLAADCPFKDAQKLGIELTSENLKLFSPPVIQAYLGELYEYLQILESRLFSSGLHVLGQPPTPEELQSYLNAYFQDELPDWAIASILQGATIDQLLQEYFQRWTDDNPGKIPRLDPSFRDRLETAIPLCCQLADLLRQNSDELTNLLRGLNGEYIPPAPGGDLLRDGPGVLPTGRNIHALDPYRMPSPGAFERGRAIAQRIIAQHLQDHQTYPETVAVMLWGLDAIKTKGESLGILLELVGAEPIKEGTGRIVRYELKPLEGLDHPRIDVLANLSGIFRDSFVNIIELLDDLFRRAGEADESVEKNFIRKHYLELQAQGIENASARLFSNPSGDFGSLVNDRITDGNWESGEELGQTWEGRNSFSYGRSDKGQARPEILKTLLQSTDRIVQQIDSVEYGLTDIQEYYANTGGLKKAAEIQQSIIQQSTPQNSSTGTNNRSPRSIKVQTSFIESFSKDITPRSLEELLRLEYRTKLLNPKWAEAMANQGSGGAYEISQRMTALMGWAGTADFKENWIYDQAAETYALDTKMAKQLQIANPEAFRNIVGRMLEAHGRGFWQVDGERLERLRSLYDQTDAALEGVKDPIG